MLTDIFQKNTLLTKTTSQSLLPKKKHFPEKSTRPGFALEKAKAMQQVNRAETPQGPNAKTRLEMIEELARRYAGKGPANQRRYLWKKYAWITVTNSSRLLKRALDIIGAGLSMLAFSPLMFLVAIAVKAYDKGPVLYLQTRVGLHGREFSFPKFRSMAVNADRIHDQKNEQNDENFSITFKSKHDPRVTPVGKIIRKFSIDELPQLWCVLLGQMSLVGPRPPLPSEVARYSLSDRRRLDVLPGLTCIWQVEGRGDIPFPKQVKLDLQYIESQSLWLDIRLLVKTVPAVLLGKGAY